jgi:hypothetical protein
MGPKPEVGLISPSHKQARPDQALGNGRTGPWKTMFTEDYNRATSTLMP